MSFDTENKDPVKQAISACTMVQFMIDFTAKQLDGLRTQCATTEEITQKEIRDAESKLVKLFSDHLVAKAKLATDEVPQKLAEYPRTEQWLLVVGVSKDTIQGISDRGITLDTLLEMSEEEVKSLLQRYGSEPNETTSLNSALRNLKICTEKQLQGEDANQDWHFTELLGVTGTKSASNSPCGGNSPKYQQRPSTSSLPPDNLVNSPQPTDIPTPPQSTPSSPLPSTHTHSYKYTPPPTPPLVRPRVGGNAKYPSTPPPKKKMQLFPEAVTITKSKSHESQLANRVIDIDPVKSTKKKPQNIKLSGSHEALFRRRLSTEGSDTGAGSRGQSGHTSPVVSSPIRSPPYKHDLMNAADEYVKYSNTLTVPKSPKTPLNLGPKMLHQISHRFNSSFVFAPCDICSTIVLRGKVCKYCKKKFHRDCASKAPPTCGLSDDYVDAVLHFTDSPLPARRTTNPNILHPDEPGLKPVISLPSFGHMPDSSSNTSSCNSSTPSSPALHVTSSGTVTSPSPAPSPQIHISQFQFPDVPPEVASLPMDYTLRDTKNSEDLDVVNTNTSNDSDKTLVDSNTSDKILLDRVDSVDSQDDPLGHSWNRQNSLSVTMKEWDIPYEELNIADPIGKGRTGTVYKGHWHGDVAIKLLDMGSDSDNQAQLAAFKLEIALLRKTRHENLVLFMGACMKPPRLAIVTSFCKGETLYSIIHVKRELFKLNRAMIVASQIAQGMGYLHAKGIVHKDLRTKNIFLDSGKVVITDFGLFSATKICRGNKKEDWLRVPPGWLCYLAPEIIRALQASQHANMDLPFKTKSDIYAFGTVWYELLCGEWPFRNQPAETIIWQVGRGMKQSLSSVNAPREVKDILMSCWVFKADDRPDFSQVAKALDRIPKNRLIRSPSHPIQLSRSTEGIFNA